MITQRLIAIAYLLTQAMGIIAWWVWLWLDTEFRGRFSPAGSEHALMAFGPGDLLLLAAAAVAGAAGVLRRAAWTGPVLWLHAGAGAYASCWAFTLAALEPARLTGAGLMLPVFVASMATAVWWSVVGGRPARSGA